MADGRIAARRQRPPARALLRHRAAAARDARRAGPGRDPPLGAGDHRCRQAACRAAVKLQRPTRRSRHSRHWELAVGSCEAFRQRQQGRHRSQLARRQRAVGARGGAGLRRTPARRASPCTRAPMRATSRRPTCARSRRCLRAARRPRRVQHRRRSAAGPARARARGEADQCTLVPVRPGEITSQAGWSPDTPREDDARPSSRRCEADGVRVSLFVDPEEAPIRWAADIGADRVELYTEPFARAFERRRRRRGGVVRRLRAGRASWRSSLGLGVNAGHDLDLDNLRAVPRVCRISTRCRSAMRSSATRCSSGLDRSVREYLDVLAG